MLGFVELDPGIDFIFHQIKKYLTIQKPKRTMKNFKFDTRDVKGYRRLLNFSEKFLK